MSESNGEPEKKTIDILITLVILLTIVGATIFAFTGLLQPVVSVSSGSMEPNIQQGTHVVLVNGTYHNVNDKTNRETVTYRKGKEIGYKVFNEYGDVIVYAPNGNDERVPVIHRPRFWVEEGENWIDKANESYLPENKFTCLQISNCPAPHSGFITKGDANSYYDQTRNISSPVKPSWIKGYATLRLTSITMFYFFFVVFLSIIALIVRPAITKSRFKIKQYVSMKRNS